MRVSNNKAFLIDLMKNVIDQTSVSKQTAVHINNCYKLYEEIYVKTFKAYTVLDSKFPLLKDYMSNAIDYNEFNILASMRVDVSNISKNIWKYIIKHRHILMDDVIILNKDHIKSIENSIANINKDPSSIDLAKKVIISIHNEFVSFSLLVKNHTLLLHRVSAYEDDLHKLLTKLTYHKAKNHITKTEISRFMFNDKTVIPDVTLEKLNYEFDLLTSKKTAADNEALRISNQVNIILKPYFDMADDKYNELIKKPVKKPVIYKEANRLELKMKHISKLMIRLKNKKYRRYNEFAIKIVSVYSRNTGERYLDTILNDIYSYFNIDLMEGPL